MHAIIKNKKIVRIIFHLCFIASIVFFLVAILF